MISLKSTPVRKTAYVMMRLDHSRFTETTLDYVRINRSLYEEIHSTDFLCFFFEYSDKFFSNNLTFFFRIRNTRQFGIETFLCVYADKV